MKKKLFGLLLIAGGSLFAQTHFSVGIGIGSPGYYASAPVYRPPSPGPGYIWTDGYYGPNGFIAGYWAAPYNYGYGGSYYVAPRYFAPYYGGSVRRDFDRDDRRREGNRGRTEQRGGRESNGRGNGFGRR